ncbi:MAG: pyridoxal phosphate-dependent aminotransferase [Candidatus Thorarchaeota archaeon]
MKLKPSATLAMNELISERRKEGEEVYHMGFGESPFPVHSSISKALCDNAGQRSYLPTQGILALREQICKFYKTMFGTEYSPEQVIVGPGSKVLLFDAIMSLEGPLLVPTPSWVSYDAHAHLSGKEVYYVNTQVEDSYLMTPVILERAIQQLDSRPDEQKLLIMNYPCNPTGQSYSASQLRALSDVAREQNVPILSDEIYALLTFQGHKHHSMAEYYPEGTIVTGGLSKDRSAGGFRLGVMLLPKEESDLRNAILRVASNTWSCVAAPMQYAALEAYQTSTELINYIRDCTALHELVTMNIYLRLKDSGIRCPAPKGAFYLFPDWNGDKSALAEEGVTTSAALTGLLLRQWNVASLPGEDFGMAADNLCIRLASVDYNGARALERFREDRRKAREDLDEFVSEIAPKLVTGCVQLGNFTRSIRPAEQGNAH